MCESCVPRIDQLKKSKHRRSIKSSVLVLFVPFPLFCIACFSPTTACSPIVINLYSQFCINFLTSIMIVKWLTHHSVDSSSDPQSPWDRQQAP